MKDYTPNAALDWSDDTDIMTITPAIIDKSKFLYAQEIGVMHAYSTFYTKRENLPSYLLLYTEGGNACLHYHDKIHHLKKGDFFFIDCMEYQYYYVESKEPWDCRFVHIYGPEIIRQYYDTFVQNTGNTLHLPSFTRIPECITRIIESYKPRNKNSDLIACMYILQLLTEAVLNSESPASSRQPDYIQNIIQYINEHYAENLTLDSISRKFNVSRTYFPKQFKAQIGVTPTEYLCQVRIQAAKKMLRHSDAPVYYIAEKVGIDNVSYFIKLFKKYEELTPYSYRNIWNTASD